MLSVNFTPFPGLKTNRLLLRRISVEDQQEIFLLRSDETVLKYLDKVPCQSTSEAVEFIQSVDRFINDNESILWGITLKDDPKIIGTICYWRLIKDHFRAEIGYALLPEFHGKGIMHEAMTAVLHYGFATMKLHSVEARVNPHNAASIQLLVKNGFKQEGFLKEDYFFNGKFTDTGIYSLLKPLK